MSLEHLRPIYDNLHEKAAPRVAELVEGTSSINDVEFAQTPWPTKRHPPDGGPLLSNVRPTVHLSITWTAEAKAAVWNDIERIQSQLGAYDTNISVNGDPAPQADPAEGNARITEYRNGGKPDSVEAEATLKVPVFLKSYSKRRDWLHGDKQMQDGPNFRVTDKWNSHGVRVFLVERWVPIPTEWEADPIRYWTGYVYLGPGEEDEWSHYNLPDKIGEPGVSVPRVTYPDHANQHSTAGEPDSGGWIGWDNNLEERDAPEDGPVEADMTEDEARQATEILAKAVREFWDSWGLTPTEVYSKEPAEDTDPEPEQPDFMEA